MATETPTTDHEIVLSLISHTNVGKTALARTLLRQDVGEVADSAHVTVVPEAYPLIEADGYAARLWDTPGFGSNLAKLAARLKKSQNPIGWFLHQVWDRNVEKSLFCSQEAIRNVQSEADVILYLVDASQSPEAIGYVDLEIEVLEWIGKPVIVFLNQVAQSEEEIVRQHESEWRVRLAKHPIVRGVATLDAFTRCWTQEHLIFVKAAEVLDKPKKKAATKLAQAWIAKNLAIFDQALDEMTSLSYFLLTDTAKLPEQSLAGRIRDMLGRQGEYKAKLDKIQATMSERQTEKTVASLNQLIHIHGLDGRTARELADAGHEDFSMKQPMAPGVSAAIGGAVSGALAGIATDLVAGGLTLGGGTLVGILLGGGAGYIMAKGYNLTQAGLNQVRWNETHFHEHVRTLLMLYLAVAHYGRGRGVWRDPLNNPAHWENVVNEDFAEHQADWHALWKKGGAVKEHSPSLEKKLRQQLHGSLTRTLSKLYPDSAGLFR